MVVTNAVLLLAALCSFVGAIAGLTLMWAESRVARAIGIVLFPILFPASVASAFMALSPQGNAEPEPAALVVVAISFAHTWLYCGLLDDIARKRQQAAAQLVELKKRVAELEVTQRRAELEAQSGTGVDGCKDRRTALWSTHR